MFPDLYIKTLHEDRLREARNERQIRQARQAARSHAGRVWPRVMALSHRRHVKAQTAAHPAS